MEEFFEYRKSIIQQLKIENENKLYEVDLRGIFEYDIKQFLEKINSDNFRIEKPIQKLETNEKLIYEVEININYHTEEDYYQPQKYTLEIILQQYEEDDKNLFFKLENDSGSIRSLESENWKKNNRKIKDIFLDLFKQMADTEILPRP